MEIKEMNFEELEQRRAELAAEIDGADSQRIDRINKELDEIEKKRSRQKPRKGRLSLKKLSARPTLHQSKKKGKKIK